MSGKPGSALEPIHVPDDVWATQDEILRARDVGKLFHLAKRYAGASQHRIATATGVPQSRVNALMNQRCGPVTSIEVLQRVADGLNMPDRARAEMGLAARQSSTEHLSLATPAASASPAVRAAAAPNPWPGSEPCDTEVVAPVPDAGRELGGPDTVEELDRALHRREVGDEAIGALEDIVVLLRRLDDEIGPGQTIGTVAAQQMSVNRLLAQARPGGKAFAGLSRVSAGLSQLAGWLSFDLNDSGKARRHLAVAYRAATASGDKLLAAYALSWQGIIVGQQDPKAGLAFTSAAHRCAGPDVPSSVRAWLARVQAEVSAGRGDRYAAEEALDRVAREANTPRTQQDPAWTYFIDDDQIAAYHGVCYVRLGLGRQAETALNTALDGLSGSFVRDRCLYLTYLSAAHVLQRQPEAAARAAIRALPLAVRTESLYSIQRLARIGDALAQWSDLPDVQEFQDLMITHHHR